MPFPELAAAMKAIAQFPGWTEPEPESGYCWFNAPLMIAGVIEHCFVLHGGYIKHVPEANVSFELRALKPSGKRTVTIARVDWKAIRGAIQTPADPEVGNLSSILTPIAIGTFFVQTRSFDLVLVLVGAPALLAAFSFLFLVGKIHRIDSDAQEDVLYP